MSNVSELACTYATLILHDEGIPVTAEKIATLVKSANVKVESYWPLLFAKLANKRNLDDLILAIGLGSAGGASASDATVAAPAGAAAPAVAVVEENKKEELKEESDDENIFDLFAE